MKSPVSLRPSSGDTQSTGPTSETVDSDFIQSLVQNLDGVDPNDPNFQELIATLNPDAQKKADSEKKEKEPENK